MLDFVFEFFSLKYQILQLLNNLCVAFFISAKYSAFSNWHANYGQGPLSREFNYVHGKVTAFTWDKATLYDSLRQEATNNVISWNFRKSAGC